MGQAQNCKEECHGQNHAGGRASHGGRTERIACPLCVNDYAGGMEILSVILEGNYFDLYFIEGKSAMQRIMLKSYSKRLMHSLKESLRAGSAGVRILFLVRQTRKAGLFKALFSDTCL